MCVDRILWNSVLFSYPESWYEDWVSKYNESPRRYFVFCHTKCMKECRHYIQFLQKLLKVCMHIRGINIKHLIQSLCKIVKISSLGYNLYRGECMLIEVFVLFHFLYFNKIVVYFLSCIMYVATIYRNILKQRFVSTH